MVSSVSNGVYSIQHQDGIKLFFLKTPTPDIKKNTLLFPSRILTSCGEPHTVYVPSPKAARDMSLTRNRLATSRLMHMVTDPRDEHPSKENTITSEVSPLG